MKSCCENKSSELVKLRERQGKTLRIVLIINAAMFVLEFAGGIYSRSAALLADSLDMLGDSIVYGFSLYVLHKSERLRAMAALLKGLIIVAFGFGVLGETIRRALYGLDPLAPTMGVFGGIALIANATCLVLLTRHRHDDLNMRSTYICSRNDIISNSGVIVAAAAVWITDSKWPDVVVGTIISVVFLKSALPILKEALQELRTTKVSDYETNIT